MDGLELCAKIKKDPAKGAIPIFILTALGSSEDTVKGLEAGAEDYLSKPFNEREFLARARAISGAGNPCLGRKRRSFRARSGSPLIPMRPGGGKNPSSSPFGNLTSSGFFWPTRVRP